MRSNRKGGLLRGRDGIKMMVKRRQIKVKIG